MEKAELQSQNVIFFDGLCHLCNGFVDALITRDPRHKFLFAPLQGETAVKVLSSEDRQKLDSVVYFSRGKTYYRSSAILKIFWHLGGIYRVNALAYLIPTSIRDWLYTLVAKNRYSWFGERNFCRRPLPEEAAYLLP